MKKMLKGKTLGNNALTLYVCMSILLCIFISGCSKAQTTVEELPLVRTQVIKEAVSEANSNYSGEVRGRYESQLAFQITGKIVKRNIDLGSVVKPGDVLMEIDSRDFQQGVNVNSAQVYSAQSQLKLAESNLNRYLQLYEQGAVSRAQYEQYQNAYDVAVAAVRQTTAQYVQGSNQLNYSQLYADSAGVISSINAEAGQVVSAGQQVVTLVKDGEREIEINIPENRVEEIRNAQQIHVSFWALPNFIVDGKVREISPVADKVSRTYKTRISLLNPTENIKLGMTANVMVDSPESQRTSYIPLSAIYQIDDKPNVWVVSDNAVTLRPIRTGSFGDGKIQVLEGLRDGDVIVIAGVQKLWEGQRVRVSGAEL